LQCNKKINQQVCELSEASAVYVYGQTIWNEKDCSLHFKY
jgi:hypothetical protein